MRDLRYLTRLATVLGVASLFGACDRAVDPSEAVAPAASRVSGQLDLQETESGYYGGQLYDWAFPAASSNDQNALVVDCFHLGVDVTTLPNNHSARLYALFLPGAHQHSCPDGSELHDHILSAVPGTPGYSTVWDLMEAWPGPSFDSSLMPITSEAALLAAAAAGQVVLLDDQFPLHAVVLGPARP